MRVLLDKGEKIMTMKRDKNGMEQCSCCQQVFSEKEGDYFINNGGVSPFFVCHDCVEIIRLQEN